jgi:hypothetical protein
LSKKISNWILLTSGFSPGAIASKVTKRFNSFHMKMLCDIGPNEVSQANVLFAAACGEQCSRQGDALKLAGYAPLGLMF